MKGNQFMNVKIEMTKARINVSDVAGEMGISPQALYNKLNGKTSLTLSDMNKIKNILSNYRSENLSLEYLFGENNDN